MSPPEFGEYTDSNGTADSRKFGTIIEYICQPGYWFDQYSEGMTRSLKCADDKTWKGDDVNECTSKF